MKNKYIITSQEQVKIHVPEHGVVPLGVVCIPPAVASTTCFLQPHRVRGAGDVREEQNLCLSLWSTSDLLLLCQNWWLHAAWSCSKPLSMQLLAAEGIPHLSYGTCAGACSLDSIPCLHQGFVVPLWGMESRCVALHEHVPGFYSTYCPEITELLTSIQLTAEVQFFRTLICMSNEVCFLCSTTAMSTAIYWYILRGFPLVWNLFLFTAIFWISENGEKYNNEFPWTESLHSGEISHAYVRESKKRLYPDYPKVWRNCRAVGQGRAAYVVLCFSVSTWETCHRRCVCSGIEGMMTAGDRSTHCGMDCCSDQVLRRTLFSRFQVCSHCLS